MRILYIASVRIPNEKASGLAIMRQCEGFSKLGHSVTLVCPRRNNPITEDPFTYYGMKPNFAIETMASLDFIGRLGILGFAITRFSQMVASYMYVLSHRAMYDMIYARDPWMLLLPIASGLKRKIIWEAHQLQRSLFVHYVASRVQVLVCISSGLRNHFSNICGRTDIMVEPSGVDIEQFSHSFSKEQMRVRHGIPVEKWVIGYIGKYMTMGEEKGVKDLICAYAEIMGEIPDAHLMIVGPEPHEVIMLQKECQKLGIKESWVSFLPLFQKNFADYVKNSDVLVMNYPDTTHYRNYMSPTKMFAYMASGIPIITTDLSTIREILDESSAYFVAPDDTQSLKLGLLKVRRDSSSLQRAKKARKEVERYTWFKRTERIISKFL